MPTDTEKQRAIEALQALPENATIEDAIERLCGVLRVDYWKPPMSIMIWCCRSSYLY
jgi:hypothetical protein